MCNLILFVIFVTFTAYFSFVSFPSYFSCSSFRFSYWSKTHRSTRMLDQSNELLRNMFLPLLLDKIDPSFLGLHERGCGLSRGRKLKKYQIREVRKKKGWISWWTICRVFYTTVFTYNERSYLYCIRWLPT